MLIDKKVYEIFYEKLLYAFAKKEFGEEAVDLRNVKIWDSQIPNHDKKKPEYIAGKLLGRGSIKDHRYFYRLYNKFINSGAQGKIDDMAFSKALEYLGYTIPDSPEFKRLSTKTEALYKQFLISIKSELISESSSLNEIPNSYLPIVEHLISNNWWFCFRGHPQDKESKQDGWWLVSNVMKFELLVSGTIKVSKIVSKDAVAERYSDCFGAIDFNTSGPGTLAINVKSLHSNLENIHIKLNIGVGRNLDLYLGEFIQQEYDGHIASGSAILLIIPNGELPKSGQFKINSPCGLYDEPLSYLPMPFRDIAFYFEDKSFNTRRTTNNICSNIEGLRNWKRKKTIN